MLTPTNRIEFERWARQSRSVCKDRADSYVLNLFENSFIVCPKSDESVTPCLVRDGMWEAWISLWFMNNIDNDTTFIDVGANCGYYSVLASRGCYMIYSFEPNPSYTELLEETARLNRSVPMCVIPYAVSDTEGGVTLYVPGHLEGSASITGGFDDYDTVEINARATTLDSIEFAAPGKVLVKIDAEGAEEKVWDGSSEFRDRHSPTFVLEYTPGAYSDDFINKLDSYGDINYIDFDGDEVAASPEFIANFTDWAMLVIRKRE